VIVVLMSTYDLEDLPPPRRTAVPSHTCTRNTSPRTAEPDMANRELKTPTTGAAMPSWRAPQVLLTAAVRSSSLLGHDLINRFRAERYELFLSGHFALWASAGVVLPLLEYALWYRTPYVLLFAAVGAPQCIALAFGLRLARLGRYSQSISLVCITNWISSVLVTVSTPTSWR